MQRADTKKRRRTGKCVSCKNRFHWVLCQATGEKRNSGLAFQSACKHHWCCVSRWCSSVAKCHIVAQAQRFVPAFTFEDKVQTYYEEEEKKWRRATHTLDCLPSLYSWCWSFFQGEVFTWATTLEVDDLTVHFRRLNDSDVLQGKIGDHKHALLEIGVAQHFLAGDYSTEQGKSISKMLLLLCNLSRQMWELEKELYVSACGDNKAWTLASCMRVVLADKVWGATSPIWWVSTGQRVSRWCQDANNS